MLVLRARVFPTPQHHHHVADRPFPTLSTWRKTLCKTTHLVFEPALRVLRLPKNSDPVLVAQKVAVGVYKCVELIVERIGTTLRRYDAHQDHSPTARGLFPREANHIKLHGWRSLQTDRRTSPHDPKLTPTLPPHHRGVTTSELDELAAETAASMTSKHPDYAQVRTDVSR